MCPKCNDTGWIPPKADRGMVIEPSPGCCNCDAGLALQAELCRPTSCPTCGNASGEVIVRQVRPCCGSLQKGRENQCPCMYHDGTWPVEAISPCPACPNGKIIAERQNGKTYHYPNAPKQLVCLPEHYQAGAQERGEPISDELAFAVAKDRQRMHDLRYYPGFNPEVRLPAEFR